MMMDRQDPFYSEENISHLLRSIEQLKAGNGKSHDLIKDDEDCKMTKNQMKAKELYPGIKDKENFSEDFLYNAICYFDASPENVVEMLNHMPAENGLQLYKALKQCRDETQKILKSTFEEHDFSDIFKDPEIEDIVFYQIAHGIPVS